MEIIESIGCANIKLMKRIKTEHLLVFAIFFLVIAGIGINTAKKLSVDRSKLPEKVETSKGFQRWITNAKNKGLAFVSADDFLLVEENEIYNTKWMKVYSTDDVEKMQEFELALKNNENVDKIIFSPSERIFVDYRNEKRGDYKANEVHLHGVRDDKIIDARILDCSTRGNCYFDRAYFLSNDLFVISEFSRNIDKKDESVPACPIEEDCEYTIKVHLIDLINNSRLVYASEPFNIVLSELIPEL